MRPSCANISPSKSEGAGNAGCPKHPQPVCKGSKHTVVTTGTPGSTGIPCTMVLTAYFAISPATSSFLSPSSVDSSARRDPVGLACIHKLDTSNGCQDHATWPSAANHLRPDTSVACAHPPKPWAKRKAPFVHAPLDRSRALRPALPSSLRDDAAAATASHPNVRDDHDPPLSRDETGADRQVICGWGQGKFLKSEATNRIDCVLK